MLITQVVAGGISDIADLLGCEFFSNKKFTIFFLYAYSYLFTIGIKQVAEDLDYLDLRCRIFLGEAGESFDPFSALKFAENAQERYGCSTYDKKRIITATLDYRILTSWNEDYIRDVIKSYYGGAITAPFPLKNINLLSVDYYLHLINKFGLKLLIGINHIVNEELL